MKTNPFKQLTKEVKFDSFNRPQTSKGEIISVNSTHAYCVDDVFELKDLSNEDLVEILSKMHPDK